MLPDHGHWTALEIARIANTDRLRRDQSCTRIQRLTRAHRGRLAAPERDGTGEQCELQWPHVGIEILTPATLLNTVSDRCVLLDYPFCSQVTYIQICTFFSHAHDNVPINGIRTNKCVIKSNHTHTVSAQRF